MSLNKAECQWGGPGRKQGPRPIKTQDGNKALGLTKSQQ